MSTSVEQLAATPILRSYVSLVPVLGTIASMPLSKQDEEKLFVMTKNALDVVDEERRAVSIRALVRSMSGGGRHSDEIVSLIPKSR